MAREHDAQGTHVRHGVTTREQWDAVWAEHPSASGSAEPDSLLPPEIEGVAPGRALDVGCGDGRNTIWLAEHGWQGRGIDFADAAIAQARAQAAERAAGATFDVADAVEYAPEERFDLVIFFYVHPVLPRVLANAARLLAPGGMLLFVGHDRSDAAMRRNHLDPSELTTVDEVVAMLPGLEIERAEVVEHEIAFGNERVPALSTLVRARRAAAH